MISNTDTSDTEKVNRPKDSNFYQQRLSAWKPILTTKILFFYLLTCGTICLAIGIPLFVINSRLFEVDLEYTDCKNATDQPCSDQDNTQSCSCSVSFKIDRDLNEKVAIYYKLQNFYQNFRLYARSRDDDQLSGKISTSVNKYCDPFSKDSSGKIYAPCGAIANSIFNDTFYLQLINSDSTITNIAHSTKDISWPSDKDKFKKVSDWTNYVKPPNWPATIQSIYPNAYEDAESLMVWMRTAPLPTFRKLYGFFHNGLKAGSYRIGINYHYPVKAFHGKKSVVLSTLNFLGGKNSFLAIAYIVVGCIQLILAIVYFVLSCRKRLPVFNTSRVFA